MLRSAGMFSGGASLNRSGNRVSFSQDESVYIVTVALCIKERVKLTKLKDVVDSWF